MPVCGWFSLLLAESSPHVPLVAVLAAVGVEVNLFEGPRELGRTGRLLLGAVRLLWRPVAFEV